MLGTAMYEVSSVGGNRVEAAAAIRAQGVPRPRPHDTVKGHMMRFLRRSKSMAQRAVSTVEEPPRAKHERHVREHHDQPLAIALKDTSQPPPLTVHQQKIHHVARNGVVVAIVDGLPFVVGTKNKNKVVFIIRTVIQISRI